MLNVDSKGNSITVYPVSAPTDAISFGTNIRCQPFSLLPLNEDQRFAVERAKKFALEQSIQNALNKQAAQVHQQDFSNLKRNQALILLSRIYVGSISFELGEDELRKVFSAYGPIKSVALSWDPVIQKHKGYAFVEFEVPEAAQLALEHMNGYAIGGRNLKVGRPSNAPQTGKLENDLRSKEDARCRVYVASIHTELTETDMQTVFEAFGKVKCSTLYPDPKITGRHRGFGFIDFMSEETAIAAVTSMNGFELAGLQLRVTRAMTPENSPLPFEATAQQATSTTALSVTPIPVTAIARAAASISAQVLSLTNQDTVNATTTVALSVPNAQSSSSRFIGSSDTVPNLPPPGLVIPSTVGENGLNGTDGKATEGADATVSMWDDDEESAAPVRAPNDVETAGLTDLSTIPIPESFSRVILLENMVSVDDLDPDLRAEVAEECSNYGHVLNVVVHVTPSSEVRIFVQFDRSDSAQSACDALNDRFFAGHVVRSRLFDEEHFQLHEFDF